MVEVEEFYEEGVEKENQEFIDALKQNKKIDQAEGTYKKNSKELRKKYEKEFQKNLKEKKKKEFKKIKEKTKPKKKKETPEYKVQGMDLDLDWKEKAYIKGSSKAYKIKRKVIDLYQENYPAKAVYLKYKTEKSTKRKYENIKNTLNKKIKTFVKNLKDFSKFLKKFYKQSKKTIKKTIKSSLDKVLGRTKKKNQKGKKEEKGNEKKVLTEKEKREQKLKEIENKVANGDNKKENSSK